ncbi:MAG: 50S ribosomal protein L25 [Candidatus Eremiobacteraeota bacterium]|nr:50S ribosomal protein L25 [Candidatus Eremiobacteraeota bacterium]MCW5871478.1 50S ribosomal protein L25 [Candidatus Eremiobacteraeota bacterium]
MAQVELASKFRKGTGKGTARKLRAVGRVPGILYGPSMEPITLDLDEKEVLSLVQSKGLNRIIALTVDGAPGDKKHICLIKDMQRDIYQQRITHLDLRKLDLNEKVVVTVRLILEGEQTIRSKGGIVEQMVRGIRVRTKPNDIPGGFSADISKLRLGQTITIGEVALPEGVELVDNPDSPIVNIFAARGSAMATAE